MSRPFYSLNDIAAIRDNPGAMLWELHQAAAYGDKERVLECLEAGADVNGRNPDFGVTALMLAAAGGYWEIAKLFLDRGAVADVRDHGGRSALDWAGARGWDDLEELIRSRLPMTLSAASLANAVCRMLTSFGPQGVGQFYDQTFGRVKRGFAKTWTREYREVLGEHLSFDCWRPKTMSEERLPLVVMAHGGGWDGGTRNDPVAGIIGNALLASGFCVATVDYRLAWTWKFPDPLCDLKAAVRYFRTNAAEFGIDPDRIGVFGHSAGAHLALLLGLTSADAQFDKFSGDPSVSSAVQAVCGISCPCDFQTLVDVGESLRDAVDTGDPAERRLILTSLKGSKPLFDILSTMNVFDFPLNIRDLAEKETAMLWQRKFNWCRSVRLARGLVHVQNLLEGKEELLRASPLTYAREPRVNGNIPPFLLLHGSKDVLIPAEGCNLFRSALREHGADVDVRIDPEGTHWHRGALELIPGFFERTLKSFKTIVNAPNLRDDNTTPSTSVAASEITQTASKKVIDKNSQMSLELKPRLTPSGQSKSEYSDEDRFIVRLLERMLEASNHNSTITKALSYAKHFLGDKSNDANALPNLSFSVSLELEPLHEGWFEAYRFYLYDHLNDLYDDQNDGFEISIVHEGKSHSLYLANSTGLYGSTDWMLKTGLHAFVPEYDPDDIDQVKPALLSKDEFKRHENCLEENIIRLMNKGAVVLEW